MSRRILLSEQWRDPWPYDGPIRRADGCASFNHYLWPLDEDWYWANRAFDHSRVSSCFNFSVVALNDGRWSTSGMICDIERNEESGRPCVFPTREQAMRHAIARFIRLCRAARKWDGFNSDRLSHEWSERLIGWALGILDRPAAKLYRAPPPALPAPTSLIEIMERAA
jgi:hypothetical protein